MQSRAVGKEKERARERERERGGLKVIVSHETRYLENWDIYFNNYTHVARATYYPRSLDVYITYIHKAISYE